MGLPIAISAVAWLLLPPGMLPARQPAFDYAATAESRERLGALSKAVVFANAPRHEAPTDLVECRFLNTPVTGTTPKFDCTLENGGMLRVKYASLELKAEVAATDLLSALGFGADDVFMARRVRCYGCPRWPYQSRQIAERLHFTNLLERHLDYDRYVDFESVSIERRDGQLRSLEFGPEEGWAFYELSKIDPALGGASREEIDALRLIAIFLAHWDNKITNQRLACESDCEHPLAMLQDLGSTFGPKKVALGTWRDAPIWAHAATCTVSMKDMPYGGGTFADVRISEGGRRLLADRLRRLDRDRIRTLFNDARFDHVDAWVSAFTRRVGQIADRPPCPETT